MTEIGQLLDPQARADLRSLAAASLIPSDRRNRMRQLNQRGFAAISAVSEIGDDSRQWIEVVPTADKVRNGPFYFTITAADLEVYAESIRANPGKIPVDYDHEGDEGGSTRAAGWFTGQARVVDEDDRGPLLTAEVEWTPRAAQEIRDGEYRMVSAVTSFNEKDKKTGLMTGAKAVVAATLTNRPFFKELTALAAAEDGPVLWDAEQGVNALQNRIAEALNPNATDWSETNYWVVDVDVAGQRALVSASGPDCDAWIVPYQVDDAGAVTVSPSTDWIPVEQAWIADTDGDDDPGPDTFAAAAARMHATAARIRELSTHGGETATNKEDSVSDELQSLAADLGLPEDATGEQITEAFTAMKAKADQADTLEQQLEQARSTSEDEVKLDRATFEKLTADATDGAVARAQQVKLEREATIDEAIKAGKIMPSRRDHFLTLAEHDPEGTSTYLDELESGVIPVDERGVNPSLETEQTQLSRVRSALGLKTTTGS